jgi:hypothetical protein
MNLFTIFCHSRQLVSGIHFRHSAEAGIGPLRHSQGSRGIHPTFSSFCLSGNEESGMYLHPSFLFFSITFRSAKRADAFINRRTLSEFCELGRPPWIPSAQSNGVDLGETGFGNFCRNKSSSAAGTKSGFYQNCIHSRSSKREFTRLIIPAVVSGNLQEPSFPR